MYTIKRVLPWDELNRSPSSPPYPLFLPSSTRNNALGADKVEFWLVTISSLRVNTDKETKTLGYSIPSIGFGTWTLGNGQGPVDQVEQALENGYNHIGESFVSRRRLSVISILLCRYSAVLQE